jgi:flagellar biosynthesis protein FliR
MISIIGLMSFMIALAIFVVANGHHLILSALNSSFTMLPIATPINLSSNMFIEQIMDLGKNLWLIAVQLSAPVVLLLFLTDFAFGIVSRVAPQVNVFMLGFQVKPSIGLVGILLTMPLFMRHIVNLTEKMGEEILKLFIALKP